MEVKIETQIRAGDESIVAQLYSQAFERKFVNLIGSAQEASLFFKDGINRDRAIAAYSAENELLGMAGFEQGQQKLIGLELEHFKKHFGFFKGIYKGVLMDILFSRKAENEKEILMDGIVVKNGHRGKGIGKKLFQGLEAYAKSNDFHSIRLDVIDENPKAKKLYEKIGFEVIKHEKVPYPLADYIGVSGVSTMVKQLKI